MKTTNKTTFLNNPLKHLQSETQDQEFGDFVDPKKIQKEKLKQHTKTTFLKTSKEETTQKIYTNNY